MLGQRHGGEDDLFHAFSEPAHIPQFILCNQTCFVKKVILD